MIIGKVTIVAFVAIVAVIAIAVAIAVYIIIENRASARIRQLFSVFSLFLFLFFFENWNNVDSI